MQVEKICGSILLKTWSWLNFLFQTSIFKLRLSSVNPPRPPSPILKSDTHLVLSPSPSLGRKPSEYSNFED